jgi:hypothetical protein
MVPWAILITGVVGVGGTALGAWLNGRTQTKTLRLSLDAENKRARLADKRRVYVSCIAAISEVFNAILKVSMFPDKSGGVRESLLSEYSAALASLLNATSELQLVGPESMIGLARDIYEPFVLDIAPGPLSEEIRERFREIGELREQLLAAMRADLGETD